MSQGSDTGLPTGKTEDAIGESESTAQTDTRIFFCDQTTQIKINVEMTNNELCSSRAGADKAIDIPPIRQAIG